MRKDSDYHYDWSVIELGDKKMSVSNDVKLAGEIC